MTQAEPSLEIWALLAVNFFGVALGVLLTGISYVSFRANAQNASLRNATVGFGLITVGLAVEPVYQLGIEGSPGLSSSQNVGLQFVEGTLISLGFLALFFSIYRYRSNTGEYRVTVNSVDDDVFDEFN